MSTENTYVELYKKYRPKTWDDIIGQDKVIETLRNVPLTGKLPTGYMFFGTHGCGKTSTAFVLAKALNCQNLQPNGNPCNECRVCKAIDENRQPGFRYISMANNGNVEDVRKLVEQATLAQPIKKPVFILDECHRLSPTAWDALLIPLESKKMSTLFIFCSTEPDKIPSTILSRLQVRSFYPVNDKAIAMNLVKIVKSEKLKIDKKQIVQITRAANGSVRDSISYLENVVANGVIPGSYSDSVLDMLTESKYTSLFNLTNKINAAGQSFTDVAQQLYEDLANILVVMGKGKATLSDSAKKFGRASNPRIVMAYLNILGEAITQMSYNTVNTRILFEIACAKMISISRKYKRSE